MLLNPSIGKLNTDDLNQRYRNSVIEYDGVFRWCNFFEDPEHCYLGKPFEEAELTKFDWKLVNCERVPTGWVPVGKRIAYLCYSDARQYSRGYQEVANTQMLMPWLHDIFNPAVDDDPGGIKHFIEALEASAKMYRNRAFIAKTSNLSDVDDYQIVNRRVAITRLVKSPFFKVWYRTMLVAFTDLEDVIVKSPLFVDDLREFFPQMKVQVSQQDFSELRCISDWTPPKRKPRPIDEQLQRAVEEMRRANNEARLRMANAPRARAQVNLDAIFEMDEPVDPPDVLVDDEPREPNF